MSPTMDTIPGKTPSLQDAMANIFEKWARFVARRPWTVILFSVLVTGGLSAGITRMQSSSESDVLWTIRTRGYNDREYVSTLSDASRAMFLYCERVGAVAGSASPSIFDEVAIMEMHKLRNWTMKKLEITDRSGDKLKFDDLCTRSEGGDGPCRSATTGITIAGPYNGAANDLAVSSWNVAGVHSLYDITREFAVKKVVPPATLDSNGHVASSSALSMVFSLVDNSNSAIFESAWNKDIVNQADSSILKVTHWSPGGLDEEASRNVSGEIPLFIIALNLVGLFLSFTLGKTRKCCGSLPLPDIVRGRFSLAWMSVLVVGFATGAGLGVAALCGVTFHSIVSLMPLVALGVQVDDCIITVNMLANTKEGKGGFEERFGKAAKESGPCVTTTSMTTVVAFALGIPSALPGVSFFCSYAASVFFFGWLFQVTFFWACVAIDEQRIARSHDCIMCFIPAKTMCEDDDDDDETTTTTDKSTKPSNFQRGLEIYANMLLHPAVAVVVVLLFVGFTATALLLVGRSKVGLPLEDILPDDSYVRAAFKTEQDIFGGRPTPVKVVIEDQDFNDAAVRTNFRDAANQVANLTDVVVKLPTWMDSYDRYKTATGTTGTAMYLDEMKAFLASTSGSDLKSQVKCRDRDKCISLKSAMFETLFMFGQEGKTLAEELRFRDAIDKILLPLFPADKTVVSSTVFMFGETDNAMWTSIIETCGYALIGILVCVGLTSSIATAVLITLSVAMIDADLLLIAYLAGIRVNSISYSCLVMACGLAVDYCVHLGHAFDHAVRKEGLDNKAAARKAITRMGGSIIQGGMTTLLGVVVLAAASSVAFRAFFMYVFSTIVLGVVHGLFLLPVLLGYLTPRCGNTKPKTVAAVKNIELSARDK